MGWGKNKQTHPLKLHQSAASSR